MTRPQSDAVPGEQVGEGEASGPVRSVLRDPSFARLWVGTTASGLATWALPFVLGLGIIHGELSTANLGVLLAVRTVGFIGAVPVGGMLSDRFSTLSVVRCAGLVAAAASLLLALSLGRYEWTAMLAATAMGMGQGACRPAFQAHVPRVVDTARRQQANAYITLAVRVSTLLGPASAAALARVMPTRGLVLIVGVLWLISAAVPGGGSGGPKPRPAGAPHPSGQRHSVRRDFVDGFVEAWQHRWFVAGLAALMPIIALGYSATNIVLPLVSREAYGTEAVFAAATMAYTLGALCGAVVMSRWRPRQEGWIAFFGIGLYSLAPVMLLVRPSAFLLIGAYVLIGVGMELFNVPWFTATQREVAADKLARVSSIDFLISYGLAPLGLAAYPWALEALGREPVLIGTALCCAVTPVLAACVPGGRYLHDPGRAERAKLVGQ